MKDLTTKLTVSMARDSHERYVIDIRDDVSGRAVVRAFLTGEQFAKALTSCIVQGIPADISNTDLMGVECERVTVKSDDPRLKSYDRDRDVENEVAQGLMPEGAGWRYDGFNYSQGGTNITLYRDAALAVETKE